MDECRICGPVLSRKGPGVTRGKDVPLSDLAESRNGGCPGCGLVLDAIAAAHPDWADFADGEVGLAKTVPSTALQISYRSSGTEHLNSGSSTFEVYGLKGFPNPFASLTLLEEIVQDTLDTALCCAKISRWLRECDGSSHAAKCHEADEGFAPRRLIHVGEAGEPDVRLVDSGDCQGSVRYLALSYCWGSYTTGIVKTLKENLTRHRRGIPIDSLPQTLQDAVAITRGLGVKYVWIDAICIVQDDDNDWETESLRMRDVYSNAFLTIAAHEAQSCNEGFLGEQAFGNPRWQMRFETIPRPDPGRAFSDPIPMLLRRKLREEQYNNLDPMVHEQEATWKTRLMERGWAFQEAVMPRRIVHFTCYEMVWECGTAVDCECGHVRYPDRPGPHKLLVKTNAERRQADGELDAGVEWTNIINAYGSRDFTNPTDKLVALSGIAKIMLEKLLKQPHYTNHTMSSIYVAGIYSTYVPRHLLWETDWKALWGRSAEASRLSMQFAMQFGLSIPSRSMEKKINRWMRPRADPVPRYHAPSWSWASVPHFFKYNTGDWDETSHISLIGAFCEPRQPGGDPTGNVTRGELEIRGVVVPAVTVALDPDVQGLTRTGLGGIEVNQRTGNAVYLRWEGELQTLVRAPSGYAAEVRCDIRQSDDADDPHALGEDGKLCECWKTRNWCETCAANQNWGDAEICCLKMATHWSQWHPGRWNVHGYFLVLKRSAKVEGAWERVGLGSLTPPVPLDVPVTSGRDQADGGDDLHVEEMKRKFENESWGLFSGGELKTLRLV